MISAAFRNAVLPRAFMMQGSGMGVFSNGVNRMYLMETGSIPNRIQPRKCGLVVAKLVTPLRKVA